MRAHPIRPCANCPYRLDAPRRHWHREEFEKVLEAESSQFGSTFACHKHVVLPAARRGVCAGWLLDQRRRGLPSIALRLLLIQDGLLRRALDKVAAVVPMFGSAKQMCRANGVRPAANRTPRLTRRHER